jgi:hypothetical protein
MLPKKCNMLLEERWILIKERRALIEECRALTDNLTRAG